MKNLETNMVSNSLKSPFAHLGSPKKKLMLEVLGSISRGGARGVLTFVSGASL